MQSRIPTSGIASVFIQAVSIPVTKLLSQSGQKGATRVQGSAHENHLRRKPGIDLLVENPRTAINITGSLCWCNSIRDILDEL